MAINKQTIISAFDDKLTLLQWLKTINKALDEAVLTGVEVRQKGNATFTFVVTFEDGTELESNQFVLAQGESINGATIRNGHLFLSLTNGDELDAGNVKPVASFEINASQHLIVNYGDGTSQDLGAIFSGNININGTLTANNIVEVMSGYSLENGYNPPSAFVRDYVGINKQGNLLTITFSGVYTKTSETTNFVNIGLVRLPQAIANKLYISSFMGEQILSIENVRFYKNYTTYIDKPFVFRKEGSGIVIQVRDNMINDFETDIPYMYRFNVVFDLSDNLAV